MIRIDLYKDNKIIAEIPYKDGYGAKRARLVHGARWNPHAKCWTFPREWSTCLEIRRLVADPLGLEIQLSHAMRQWAVEEKERQAQIPDLSLKDAVELPILKESHPKIYNAIQSRGFQSRGALFSAKARRQLLAYDPGLGKTVTTIAGMIEGGVTGLILVVAPSQAVQVSWPLELMNWVPDDFYQIIGTNISKEERGETLLDLEEWAKENPEERCWVLMNPFYVRAFAETDEFGKYKLNDDGEKIVRAELPELFQVEFSGIVVDESQETLACSTGNVKKWTKQRSGMGALKAKPNAIRVSISGTPMRGRPENMFGQLNWLRPDIYVSYWKWVERHFAIYEDASMMSAGKVIGELIDPEAFWAECAIVTNRVTKEEVAEDLPPKVYGGTHLHPDNERSVFGVWLPLEGKQRKAYDQMAKSAAAELEDGTTLQAQGILAEMTRLKQFAGSTLVFDRMATAPVLNQEWLAWYDNHCRIQDLAEKKAQYIELGAESQADTLYVPEETSEPDKYMRDENGEILRRDDIPVYRAELPSNKFYWILNFLRDRDIYDGKKGEGQGAGKVLIASQFTSLVNLFSEELKKKGVRSYKLTGETPAGARRNMVHDFQNNPDSPRVFFLNTKAGGTALTLDAADDVIICDETFIPDDQLQVEDRAHRLSRVDHTVHIWYLRSRGTIEETIGSTTTEREAVCKSIMDGARGVAISKIRSHG